MQHLIIYNKAYRELIREFRLYLKRMGYNKGSQATMPSCVQEFFYCLEQRGINHLEQITPQHISKHYDYLTERPNHTRPGGLSPSHVNHHIYALRTFMNYQQQQGRINVNPFGVLTFPRPEYGPRQTLSPQQIKALYQAAETLRDTAILSVFYGCGLRKSEAEKLDIKDVHFKSQLLYVREGKGKRRRVVPLTQQVKADLKNYYLYERDLYANLSTPDNQNAFILNNRGGRMSGGTYWERMKYLVGRAGLPKTISLHHLRHSIATHLLESGLSIEQVRDFLGHRYLESTQVYTRISKQYLTKQII